MPRDNVTELLLKVSRGEVSVEDAKTALSDVELTEDQLEKAIDHGVFNTAEPGTVISAKLAPSGGSYLAIFFFGWGIFLGMLLVVYHAVWSIQQVGPAATFISSCYDFDSIDYDGCCLHAIHPT